VTAGEGKTWVLYEWLSEAGYFLQAVVPDYTRLPAQVDDRLNDVLDAVPAATTHFAFHLNCTVTERFPEERAALVEALRTRGVQVLNAGATDISKQRVQQVCATLGLNIVTAARAGDPDELIIVKTDLNFGGDSEWALSESQRAALGIREGSDIIWKPNHYRVLPRKEVEAPWWEDLRLVRERFVVNRDDRWYRVFLFLDRLAVCELWNPHQIKKVNESRVLRVWMVPLAEESVPADAPAGLVEGLRRFVRAFPLDFGTVDAVADDAGGHYIIDVNTTAAYNYPIEGVVEYMRGASGAG
jgi:hypothetical protein